MRAAGRETVEGLSCRSAWQLRWGDDMGAPPQAALPPAVVTGSRTISDHSHHLRCRQPRPEETGLARRGQPVNF